MPINEVNFSSGFVGAKAANHTADRGAFASVLQGVSAENSEFSGLKSSPVAGGKSFLSSSFWPERYDAGVAAGAEKVGLDADALKAEFSAIMQKANDEDGYLDPRAFMKSLTREEREIVQVTQGLADPITSSDIDGLSEEGALNLLLPQGVQKDWNKDGLYSVGKANGFRFPTDSTPADVRVAWEETTKGMSEKDLMMAEGRMMSMYASANFKLNGEGKIIGTYQPGDAEIKDPFKDMDFADFALKRLAWNEHVKHQISPEQYERDKAFWTSFGNNLQQQQTV